MRRMIKSALRRFGLWPVVGLVTLLSVAVSVAIAAAVHAFVLHIPMPPAAWALSVGCPLLLAPTMSVGSFSLLLKLDLAHEQLRHLSETDPLTGARNRRYVMERLRAAAEALHAGACGPFALALIDVDNFKQVNDRHGHLAGDEVLRQLAGALADEIRRPSDLLARYHGDQFVALLPDTDGTGAGHVADRLLGRVRDLRLPYADNDIGHVTVSIGLATLEPKSRDGLPEFLSLAADALGTAKQNGRNQLKTLP